MITLYDFPLDDACYKARLGLALLGLEHRAIPVDVVPGAEQRGAAMLALNPAGTLPVLTDGAIVLHGAEPILQYLALYHDPARTWLPQPQSACAAVLNWLGFAAGPLHAATRARAQAVFEQPGDNAADRHAAREALRLLEDHMVLQGFAGRPWVAGNAPTLADIALFPAFALSNDFGISHELFPALRAWSRRLRALPGFVVMPGIPAYG